MNLSLQNAEPFAVTPVEAQVAASTTAKVVKKQPTTAEIVRGYFKDAPIMANIAWCESKYRQHDTSGAVLRGVVNNRDVGIMQINETYHAATAGALGIDLHTLEGNLQFARYLYEREGTRPWSSSKGCWGSSVAAL